MDLTEKPNEDYSIFSLRNRNAYKTNQTEPKLIASTPPLLGLVLIIQYN